MKILIFIDEGFQDEEFQAERIVKGEDYIVGYDLDKNELFAFRGITDFTPFSLKNNAEWDLPDPKPRIPKIVDNLDEGGRDDVLSAEQGKVIKGKYDETTTELTRLATTMATNVQAGLTKIDDKTIKTNNLGQLYVASQELEVPKWESIDGGVVAYGLFNQNFSISNNDGSWFFINLGTVPSNRLFNIDLTFTPSGMYPNTFNTGQFDMTLVFEKGSNNDFISAYYYSKNPSFDDSNLKIVLNDNGGEFYVGVRLVKNSVPQYSSTMLCSVNKFIVKGTEGQSATINDVEFLDFKIATDSDLVGITNREFSSINKIGNLDIRRIGYTELNNPFVITSGYYLSHLSPEPEDDLIDNGDNQYIIRLNKELEADGSVVRFWTAYEVDSSQLENPEPKLQIKNTFHKIDGVDNRGNLVAKGSWRKANRDDYLKLQADVQTLFTGWANEISRASVALTRLHVPTATDATMKTVVDNIEKVQVGKRVFIGKTKATTATSFYQYGYNGATVSNVTCSAIDTTAIPFDIGMIYIGSNQTGWGAVICIKEGDTVVVSRSIPSSTTMNDFTWRVSSTGSIPKTTEFKIPTNYSTSYDFIAYEK